MKRLTISGTALSLGLFFDVSFILCVLWGLAVPKFHADWLLEAIMPGFTWLTLPSVILGLGEAFLYGVYVALVFVPLFNHFEGGQHAGAESQGLSERRETTPAGPRHEEPRPQPGRIHEMPTRLLGKLQ